MKKYFLLLITCIIACSIICACGSKAQTGNGSGNTMTTEATDEAGWLAQYDLGIRLLSEGKYEEAILAFQAAIKIEPKKAELYVALADAYAAGGQLDKAQEVLANAPSDVDDVAAIQSKAEEIDSMIAESLEAAIPVNEYGQPINEYGSVIFEEREQFIAYEEWDEEAKNYFEQAAALIIASDMEGMEALMTGWHADAVAAGAVISHNYWYTVWNEYKASYWLYIDEDSMDLNIELRPENGMGYIMDYNRVKRYDLTLCNCTDWQWNGEMTRIEVDYNDDEDSYYHMDVTETATVVNGIFDGEFIREVKKEQAYASYGWQKAPDHLRYVRTYKDGYLISSIDYDLLEGTEETTEYNSTDIHDIVDSCGDLDSLYW